MENKELVQQEVERVGRSIKIELDNFYRVYKSALPFKQVFTKYATTAKKVGLGLAELSDELEKAGYIKLALTPSNKRYVISPETDMTDEELTDHVVGLEYV